MFFLCHYRWHQAVAVVFLGWTLNFRQDLKLSAGHICSVLPALSSSHFWWRGCSWICSRLFPYLGLPPEVCQGKNDPLRQKDLPKAPALTTIIFLLLSPISAPALFSSVYILIHSAVRGSELLIGSCAWTLEFRSLKQNFIYTGLRCIVAWLYLPLSVAGQKHLIN